MVGFDGAGMSRPPESDGLILPGNAKVDDVRKLLKAGDPRKGEVGVGLVGGVHVRGCVHVGGVECWG